MKVPDRLSRFFDFTAGEMGVVSVFDGAGTDCCKGGVKRGETAASCFGIAFVHPKLVAIGLLVFIGLRDVSTSFCNFSEELLRICFESFDCFESELLSLSGNGGIFSFFLDTSGMEVCSIGFKTFISLQ